MLDKVRRAMARHGMTRPGERVLVAVSGGPDSMALLHALHALAPELEIELHVYTLDHGLRGAESAADAAYVAATASALGLPCTAESLDAGAVARQNGQSLQAAARHLRYERLTAVAAAVKAQRIATGHNREDQAETVLLRLLRGAGGQGLAGIPPVREGLFIRPLLTISRAEIETFLADRDVVARRDPSNDKPIYLRNRIRLELLPQLQREYNPRLTEILAATAERLRQDADYLDVAASAAWPSVLASPDDSSDPVALRIAALLDLHPALAGRVLRRAAVPLLGGTRHELSSNAVAAILELAERGHGQIDVGGGVIIRAAYGRLTFGLPQARPSPLEPVAVPVPGEVTVPALGIRVLTGPAADGAAMLPPEPDEIGRAVFVPDRLPGPLTLRTRRPGDRLAPVGMVGTQKLQDLLVNSKVPRHRRDRIPLLVAGDQVLWVVGLRLDRRWSVPLDMAAQVPRAVVVRMYETAEP